MEEEISLINQEGEKITSDKISSHIGLAYLILERDEELKKEFEQSGKRNPLEFLLGDKGWMTTAKIGEYYKKIVYDSEIISDSQKKWIEYYLKKGYRPQDLAMEKKNLERGE